MTINARSIEEDLVQLRSLDPVPVKRAAYSDRTAWLMSALCQLAYIEFERTDRTLLAEAAREIAEAGGDTARIEARLEQLSKDIQGNALPDREILARVLAAAGFELLDDFAIEDTEGFIVKREATPSQTGLAVMVFRGTTSMRDWRTNLDGGLSEPEALKREARHLRAEQKGLEHGKPRLHEGFWRAYLRIEARIEPTLKQVEHLPLYITGHSLGGAVAVVATWRNEAPRNAACYTFGSPRVGNGDFAERFKTPIYRIVNGPDPVAFVPPTVLVVLPAAWLLGLLPYPWGDRARRFVIRKFAGYRHFGYGQTLHKDEARFVPEVTVIERVMIMLRMTTTLFKYHQIGEYRRKLREIALRRNTH
ncbi:lipase family protein [Marinicauda algicola]|uniref:Lipase family protein n=1 Tax=Marinicauda algicola TaxID=2029849 RepID=A0A4S2H091_9PROT|nr:lipase family protein [Marinicauda algicola]TGY88896.1 lipase family protein [Marinicauda algicola]